MADSGLMEQLTTLDAGFLHAEDSERLFSLAVGAVAVLAGPGRRQAGSIFVSAAQAIPFAFTAGTVRTLTQLLQRGVVTVASNVSGPRKRLRPMGPEVVRPLLIATGIARLTSVGAGHWRSTPAGTLALVQGG
jgi:diacylglycerol O-acyltransferase